MAPAPSLSSPRWTVPLAATVAVVAALAVLPAGGASTVEEGHFRFVQTNYIDQTFSSSAFHPTNGTALVAGGNGSYQAPYQDRVLVRYDGSTWDLVLRQRTEKGKFVDVGWSPQGDLALLLSSGSTQEGSIIVCEAPCTDASDHMTEIWQNTFTNYTQGGNPYAKGGFPGRRIIWHPSGEHALITGGGLLQWNRTHVNLVDAGRKKVYNAGAWHPNGNWSLLQRDLNKFAVCQDPCRSKTQLRAISETNDLYFCKWHCGTPTASKSIESITFGPDGRRAYVVGMNYCENCTGGSGGRGLVMEIAGLDPHAAAPDPANWTTRFLVPHQGGGPSFGEATDLAWHPTEDEMLVTKSLDLQVTRLREENGTVRRPFETLMDLDSGAKMHEVDWSPDGRYAIIPFGSGFVRYDDDGYPVTEITSPDAADVTTTEPVNVTGTVTPKPDGARIQEVQVRTGELVWTGGRTIVDWNGPWRTLPASNLTRAPNGTVQWSLRWNASARGPGDHTLAVRARDTDLVGPSASLEVTVPRGNGTGLQPPTDVRLTSLNRTTRVFTMAWDPVPNATSYLLEAAPTGSFENGSLIRNLDANTTTYEARQDAEERWYRVRAFVEDDKTPWSAGLEVDWSGDDRSQVDGSRGAEGGRTEDDESTSSFPDDDVEDRGDNTSDDDSARDGSGNRYDRIGEEPDATGRDDRSNASGGDADDPGGSAPDPDGPGAAEEDPGPLEAVPGPGLPAVVAGLAAAARSVRRRRT